MKKILLIILLCPLNLFPQTFSISPEELQKRLDLLAYDKFYKQISVTEIKSRKKYSVLEVRLESIHPLTKKKLKTEFLWYRPNRIGNNPLLIILPPVLDVTPFDLIWANQFASRHNFNVFVLKYNEKLNDENRPISDVNIALASVMTSARLMIDFAETQKKINTKKIATYGMSLGGILSSIFISIEPRVDAAVLIVAGGNLAEIMAKSDQGIVAKFRKSRMKAENLESVEELEHKMRETFLFDPLIFAPRRPAQDIYMVIADDDLTVPTKNQLELWEAFGRPQELSLPGKHFQVILKNLFQHKFIYEFLRIRLGQEDI